MTHTHTPGPWTVASRSDAAAIVDGHGNRLACLSYGRKSVSMKIESDATNANARLIAAAPDLLAALKSCRRVMTDNGIRIMVGDTDIVTAAIDKATTP